MTLNQQSYLLFAGAYAEANEKGIRSFSMRADTGELVPLDTLDGLKSPTFLTIDHQAQKAVCHYAAAS